MAEIKKRVPKRRFKEFQDAEVWEECKLGEVAPLRGGYAFQSNKFQDDGVPIVKISNILTTGEVGANFDFYMELIDDERFSLPDKAALIAMSGATTGKVAILSNPQNKKVYQNQRVGYFVKNNSVNYSFLSVIIRSHLFTKQLFAVLVAGAQPNVSSKDIGAFAFMLPKSLKEQQKIGIFFQNLDSQISLQQRKLEKIKAMKKAYLSEMFPAAGQTKPKRRFKGFTEDWVEMKLSSICSMHARIGWQNLRTSEFLDSGDYYLITGTDFNDGRINFDKCHYVERNRYEQDRKIQISNGSILITKDGTLGKVAYVEGLNKPATLNAGVFNVTVTSKNVDEKYLFQYLKAPFLMDYVSSKATGGTIKHLNQNILVDFPVILPKVKEQKKIGNFFSDLDKQITLHQKKLSKLKNLKKSYLNEMFI